MGETAILAVILCLYFGASSILRDAYLTRREGNGLLYAVLRSALILLLLSLLLWIVSRSRFVPIADGRLTGDDIGIVNTAFCGGLAGALWVKWLIGRLRRTE